MKTHPSFHKPQCKQRHNEILCLLLLFQKSLFKASKNWPHVKECKVIMSHLSGIGSLTNQSHFHVCISLGYRNVKRASLKLLLIGASVR